VHGNLAGLLELILVFGLAIGFGLWQLRDLRRRDGGSDRRPDSEA
jgi:hypothetical protein